MIFNLLSGTAEEHQCHGEPRRRTVLTNTLKNKNENPFCIWAKKNHLWEIHFANCYLCHGERSRHLHGGRRCNAVLIRGGAGRFPPSNVLSTSKQAFPWPSTASWCSRVLGHVEEVLRYFFWIQDRKQRCLEVRWVSCRGLVAPILWRSSESEDSAGLSPLWGESSSHPQSEPDSWQSNWDPAAVASTASKAFPSLQTGRGQRVFWSLNRGPGLLGKVLYFCTGQWWIQWVVIESKWRKSRNPIKSLEDLIFSAANLIRWSNKIRSAEVTEAKFCESENVFYKYFLKLHRVVDEVARARIRWLRGNTN